LNQLPRTSHFHAALHRDEQRAEDILHNEHQAVDTRTYRPPLETWTQEAELLALIADLLAYQRADFAQVNSKSRRWRAPQPVPRPETALERLKRRKDRQQHDGIVRSMLGA
jgi:hypothetical protein